MSKIIVNGVIITERDYLYEKWDYLKKTSPQPGWASRMDFIEWSIATGFTPEASLIRKDKTKPHGPDNCYWKVCVPTYRMELAADRERALLWNKTVNRFRRALGLPLFPEK